MTTFLCLPVYMVPKYEGHDNDQFRLFVKQEDWETKSGTFTVGCLCH